MILRRGLDRPLVLSHSRGLKSHDSISKILESCGRETVEKSAENRQKKGARMKKVDSRKVASLRGSEATEAIHKAPNADSSVKVDRHADKSARDDRETRKEQE